MNKKKREKVVDAAVELGSSTAGALVGAGIGSVVAGPAGAIGGAIAGTAIENAITWAGREIKERQLSNAEDKKIGTVYSSASEIISMRLTAGDKLRDDDFYTESVDSRSSAKEILEGVLFAAQREAEEKKIPYMARLFANINFDKTISRQMSVQLVKIAGDLTYRQLVEIAVIAAYQTNRIIAPKRLKSYGEIHGVENISIASEIFDLYRRSIVFSKNAFLDAAGMTPETLIIGGIGVLLHTLMELEQLMEDELAKSIISFLSGTSADGSSIIASGSISATFG